MDQVQHVIAVAHDAQPNTTLADATISVAGFPALNNDLRDYYNHDLRFIMIATLIVVFLILVYCCAPSWLRYTSSFGGDLLPVGAGRGRDLLPDHRRPPLSWSVPGMAFIVLVAVGADYNMLLMSRVRDESPHCVRAGVIKTVGTTGGVITRAGLIFAGSMFGLLFGKSAAWCRPGSSSASAY